MKKIKTVVIAIVCISLVVGFYYYLSNRTPKKNVENTTEADKVAAVLAKNLETSYPATPREVIKYYNRLLTCFYNEKYTDDEFDKMVDKMQTLFDADLLTRNPKEQYAATLQGDVAAYQAEKKVVATAEVCSTDEVEYATVEDVECAYVDASYFIRSSKAYYTTNQQFVLRKDSDGNWKILGFELLGGEDTDAEE